MSQKLQDHLMDFWYFFARWLRKRISRSYRIQARVEDHFTSYYRYGDLERFHYWKRVSVSPNGNVLLLSIGVADLRNMCSLLPGCLLYEVADVSREFTTNSVHFELLVKPADSSYGRRIGNTNVTIHLYYFKPTANGYKCMDLLKRTYPEGNAGPEGKWRFRLVRLDQSRKDREIWKLYIDGEEDISLKLINNTYGLNIPE